MRQFIQDRDVKALVGRHSVFLGAVVAACVLAFVVYDIVHGQQQNRRAIEKSCILLSNAIVVSQSQASSQGTGILIREILKLASEHGDTYVVVQFKHAQGTTSKLGPINCARAAKYPDRIHPIVARP